MDPSPFEVLISNVTTFVGEAVDWIGDFTGTITSDTFLILCCVAVPLSGWGISAIRRLMSRKA